MIYYSIVMKNDTELYHYGVKGMKWGKRNKHRTGVKGRDGSKVSSKDGKPLKVWQNIDTDYTNTPNEYINWNTGSLFGPTYESYETTPAAGKPLETLYGKPGAISSGSKFVDAIAKVKSSAQLSNLRVTKAAVSLCDSKAPTALKLLGLGVAVVSNKVTDAVVKKANTVMLKSAMKKK